MTAGRTGGDDEAHVRNDCGRLVESGHRAERSLAPAMVSVALHLVTILAALRLTTTDIALPRFATPAPAEHVSPVKLSSVLRRSTSTGQRGGARVESPRSTPPRVERAPGARVSPIQPPSVTIVGNAFSPSLRLAELLAPTAPPFATWRSLATTTGDVDESFSPALAREALAIHAALDAGQFAPPYPDELRPTHPDGRVIARFVIDSSGRVEPASIAIVMMTHRAFGESVRRTLPLLRFVPSRRGGRAVPMRVEEMFDFHCAC